MLALVLVRTMAISGPPTVAVGAQESQISDAPSHHVSIEAVLAESGSVPMLLAVPKNVIYFQKGPLGLSTAGAFAAQGRIGSQS